MQEGITFSHTKLMHKQRDGFSIIRGKINDESLKLRGRGGLLCKPRSIDESCNSRLIFTNGESSKD